MGRLLFFVLLGMPLLLVLAIAAYGFTNGHRVLDGLQGAARLILQRDIIYSDQRRVAADVLDRGDAVVTWRGKLESQALGELSGLAASHIQKNVFYAINDSGNEFSVYAMTADGRHLSNWPLAYDGVGDFEDLASFELDGKAYLLIADTGDNFYWRETLSLLVIEQPEASPINSGATVSPVWRVDFTLPSGARDLEAVAVDPEQRKVYLVSKRHVPAEVFVVPLQSTQQVTATYVTRMPGVPAPTETDIHQSPWHGRASSSPTALDMHARRAILVTYKEAYLYKRQFRQSWPEAFAQTPVRIALPEIHGLEAVAMFPGADRFLLAGERDGGRAAMDVFEVRF